MVLEFPVFLLVLELEFKVNLLVLKFQINLFVLEFHFNLLFLEFKVIILVQGYRLNISHLFLIDIANPLPLAYLNISKMDFVEYILL